MNSITENISGRTEGNGRLTRQEVSWVLYDVGNSAFTMMVSTIIPIYLDVLAEGTAADYLAIWSYAVSAATLISAVIGLIMGGLSDHRGLRKPIFAATVLIGALFCGFMGFAGSWQIYLIVFIIARILYSNSLVLYDSMLPVTLEIRPTSVVPMNEAPFPQMSYRPKYSPDIADGISRA